MYVCMYVCLYVCMYVCMYVYVCLLYFMDSIVGHSICMVFILAGWCRGEPITDSGETPPDGKDADLGPTADGFADCRVCLLYGKQHRRSHLLGAGKFNLTSRAPLCLQIQKYVDTALIFNACIRPMVARKACNSKEFCAREVFLIAWNNSKEKYENQINWIGTI